MNRVQSCMFAVIVLVAIAGCGTGGGITIDGYDLVTLNGKRIAMLLPSREQVALSNPDQFAYARGVAVVSATDMLDNELRSLFTSAVDGALDSNLVTSYTDQPIGQLVPLDVQADFKGSQPTDMQKLERASRDGNFDFMLAITALKIVSVPNEMRGREGATIDYTLIDPVKNRVMTSGRIELEPSEMIAPPETYNRIARELARRLPFHIAPAIR